MKSGERIVGMLANMRCKSRHCTGIAGFKLRVCIDITFGPGRLVLLDAQRFECVERGTLAPENEITHRPAAKFRGFGRERSADAYAGAELLVCSFQTRRDIDRIAIGGVVEEATASEITDDRWAGVNPDAGY